MNVSMFVGTSQSQASSVLSKSQHDQQAYERMLQALQQFINEDRLSSTAYTNAKGFYSAVLTPLAKAGILLSEAVGEACQKFVQDYQSNVDSGDLKSDELEEKIRQLDMRISQLDSIRATIEGKDLADNFKIRQLNQNSQAKTLLEDSKKVLQEKLDKLLEFHGTSPDIFSAISELESIVNQGAAQAGSSFTGSGFSIPTDLGWTSSVAEKWQTRTDNIKKKEKEFHEKNIKELEKHNVYAWPYEDPETKEIKIMWFIDKDGVRVFDKELQDYVERYGKNLEGIYEVVGWDKIYELDLAARRRGDGKNYLNSNQLENWKTYSQVGAHVESAYWMANKTGLLDLALMAGLAYVNKKTKVSTSSNVANVLDDAADAKKASGAEIGIELSDNVRELMEAGKYREALDFHYEDLIRRQTGGSSQILQGREIDVVTDDMLIQAKRSYTALEKPKNFLSKSTRKQIKETARIASETGRQGEYWFKYGCHPDVRKYIESKGLKVIEGLGRN
ncbi:hypothetical protein I6N96_08255 [Enterococcus sp. BWM-S5]|uniref:LXG domain-containing protein n=1 Tax=Enterococcus larvae TaxID=2794352 RepID=A0ABS4CI25_9ENTE|nr:restriction endonuclease fold toxin [Enterococcus larvae]MBP1046275.1 hypothetical protein [Enterococcus larvae]